MASQPPAHSTRLENLRFAAGRATVEIDGNIVEFAGEKAGPTIQAFQSFYQEAYRAYGTAPQAARETLDRPPWWQRLRGWLARWLGPAEEGGTRPPGASAYPKAGPARPEAAFHLAEPTAVEGPKAETKARRASAAVESSPAAAKPGDPPLLMAAFADEKGVHLLWNLTPGEKTDRIKERTYGFDSPVAARLQECYGKLSELGYDVVDLKLWQISPETAPAPATAAAPATKPSEKKSPSPNTAERVMRLLPPDSDHPTRIAVTPVEGDPMPRVFSESARRVAALHAAADPARPIEQRLTFLTCTVGPKETKVIKYGLGQHASKANEPKDWKDIAELPAETQKSVKPTKSETKPKPEPAEPGTDLFPA